MITTETWARSICLVGPMLGGSPGWVLSQGEVLGELLRQDGYEIRLVSRKPSRPTRLVDTIWSMVSVHRRTDAFVVFVFSGLGFVMADVSSLLARLLRTPLVLTLHGGNLPSFLDRHGRWVRRVLARADVVVAPSRFLAELALREGVAVRVIPNALPIPRYRFELRRQIRPRILWMRTFEAAYNPELALWAFQRIVATHPHARLTMAGQDKGLLAPTRRIAAVMGLNIDFVGFLDEEAKRAAFSDHDIFLNTNSVDNAPVSVLEAAASGMLVVSTNVGGIPALLTHEGSALLVDDDDPEGVARAVERLLTDPDLCERLSHGAREVAEASTWPNVRARWGDVFSSLPAKGDRDRG